MSHWNIRIIHHDKDEHPWFGVHEVFYNDDQSIYAYTTEAIDISGETEEDVKEYVRMIVKDIESSPILNQSEIVIVDDDRFNWAIEEK